MSRPAATCLALLAIAGCGGERPAPAPPPTVTMAGTTIHPANIQAGASRRSDSVAVPRPAPDSAAIRIGGELFNRYNCDGCHSDGAAGAVGPSLADGRWRYGGSVVEIEQSILEGRPAGMPSYRAVVGDQVRYLAAYLLSLEDTTHIATQNLETWEPRRH